MNKTFLLTAVAPWTEGAMLLVIDSLDDFRTQFIAYHAKKREFMLNGVPEFFDCSIQYGLEWPKIVDKHNKLEIEFVTVNNNKPFDFEFSTGCVYIKEGRGAGNFYDDLDIVTDSNFKEDNNCWKVVKQFMSDLSTGTHYCSDYSA